MHLHLLDRDERRRAHESEAFMAMAACSGGMHASSHPARRQRVSERLFRLF
jgi:hypothetical protein